MKQVYEAEETETPAKAAAEVLGYNYKEPEEDGQLPTVLEEEGDPPSVEEDPGQNPPDLNTSQEIKDRLMHEIKEKISERRKKILQQRKELFNEGPSEDSVTLEDVQVGLSV